MEAVATAAIGGARGAVLRGQPVVALEEGFHAVGRQVVFGVQALGCVALAANFAGDFEGRTFPEGLDLCSEWQSVQVAASRRPAATALPWTLSITSLASCSWHRPQVRARLAKFRGEAGEAGGSTP